VLLETGPERYRDQRKAAALEEWRECEPDTAAKVQWIQAASNMLVVVVVVVEHSGVQADELLQCAHESTTTEAGERRMTCKTPFADV